MCAFVWESDQGVPRVQSKKKHEGARREAELNNQFPRLILNHLKMATGHIESFDSYSAPVHTGNLSRQPTIHIPFEDDLAETEFVNFGD
jgi:hypothetical protein